LKESEKLAVFMAVPNPRNVVFEHEISEVAGFVAEAGEGELKPRGGMKLLCVFADDSKFGHPEAFGQSRRQPVGADKFDEVIHSIERITE
jgi:hypothetical protein